MSINSSTSPGLFGWDPAAWLRIAGADAATFLQGQLTNDLKALAQRTEVYGLWLSVKGKVLADSFVLRGAHADEFWIGSYFSPAAVIRERLEGYIIADDVTIDDQTAAWSGVSFLGAETEGEPSAGRGRAFRGRRVAGGNAEWVFPREERDAVVARLAARWPELSADEIARRRIGAGIPAVPADVGPTDLPNEAGLETEAISYTKGCYLGQEVMARLKSMGQVRRRLLRVDGQGGVPAVPAAVFAGARQVGELRSVAPDGAGGWVGLAMLSLLQVMAGTPLALAPDGAASLQLRERP